MHKNPLYKLAGEKEHETTMPAGANTGLWFTRFFNAYHDGYVENRNGGKSHFPEKEWTLDATLKKEWIDTVAGERGDKKLLAEYEQRHKTLAQFLQAEVSYFNNDWHFATGLGNNHPVENGLTWHPTLGVPYLPSSGVKGLLRAFVQEWMEIDNEDENLEERWFGSHNPDDESNPTQTGGLVFFDAIPTEPVKLACDIMTPHMGEWYAQGDKIISENYAIHAPADWHSPVPIPFLVVKKINLLFMIAPRDNQCEVSVTDAKNAMSALENALKWIGAGAKTAVGYGRFKKNVEKNNDFQSEKYEALSPAEKLIHQLTTIQKAEEAIARKQPGGVLDTAVSNIIEQSKSLDEADRRLIYNAAKNALIWLGKDKKKMKEKLAPLNITLE